ncbi:hypothetical protein [Halorhodospira neutriphila]|uniref:Outer membrane protein beta-barrel domain-containing protein n=1 Tax=Halorhodospira neutriphila TaxID=168379 RepID=A0ABS1E306_9GAMM|nr:hypothetical protein [Halorhodospira neutriphila]MBK1725873.1 hypothetical protein [Halorhodospira neutriphila]
MASLLLAMAAGGGATFLPPAWAADAELLRDGWRLHLAYGSLQVDGAPETGRAATLALGHGAYFAAEQGADWDFELGLAYTETVEGPRVPSREELEVTQTELYYRARRQLGDSEWFLGWHAAFALRSQSFRIQEGDRSRQGVSAGVLLGWIAPAGFSAQFEAILTDPELEGLGLGYAVRQYRLGLGVPF